MTYVTVSISVIDRMMNYIQIDCGIVIFCLLIVILIFSVFSITFVVSFLSLYPSMYVRVNIE